MFITACSGKGGAVPGAGPVAGTCAFERGAGPGAAVTIAACAIHSPAGRSAIRVMNARSCWPPRKVHVSYLANSIVLQGSKLLKCYNRAWFLSNQAPQRTKDGFS